MNYREQIDSAYGIAKSKGWHEKKRSFYEVHALFHTEVSEATESARENHPPVYQRSIFIDNEIVQDIFVCPGDEKWRYDLKTEGEAIELADLAIRIFDFIGEMEDRFNTKIDEEHHYLQFGKIESLNKMPCLPLHCALHEYLSASLKECVSLLDDCILDECGVIELERALKDLFFVIYLLERYFESNGWSLEQCIKLKSDYNKTREYRHGNKNF